MPPGCQLSALVSGGTCVLCEEEQVVGQSENQGAGEQANTIKYCQVCLGLWLSLVEIVISSLKVYYLSKILYGSSLKSRFLDVSLRLGSMQG